MEKSLDERAAALAGSYGDIRIPLDIAARLHKSRAEKKETVDGIDLEKISAQKKNKEGEEPEAKPDEKPETEDEIDTASTPDAQEMKGCDYEKSFRSAEGSTLQKARLQKLARVPDPFFVKVGKWVSESLAKSDIATLRKAVAIALPDYQHESKGKTIVAGLKEPKAVADCHGDAKIVRINTEIAELQCEMSEKGADPYDNSVIFNKLHDAYERLAEAVMDSMGLGAQTEDLIAPDPKTESPAAMVAKSQAEPVVIPENTGAEVIVSQ